MPTLVIENEELLKRSLGEGFNLFLGAGFSVLATNLDEEFVPLGSALGGMLRKKFKLEQLDEKVQLPGISAIIKATNSDEFREFIKRKYSVLRYPAGYDVLGRRDIRCKSIFTTNVDDLIQNIIDSSREKYLRDCFLSGPAAADESHVNFYALHGNVRHPTRDFVFSSSEIAAAFTQDPRLWSHFSQLLSEVPTLFWGYGLNDAAPLSAIYQAQHGVRQPPRERWLVCHPSDAVNESVYRAMGFMPIFAETPTFLDYLGDFRGASSGAKLKTEYRDRFPEFVIPPVSKAPVRKLDEYYLGAEPEWIDVYQAGPAETSHLTRLRNAMASGRNVIMKGIPFSGKSTLLKQAAIRESPVSSDVLFTPYLDANKARLILSQAIPHRLTLFWDNVFDSLDALSELQNAPNIQIIAADREINFESAYHRLDLSRFEILDVTDLTPMDVETVKAKIPPNLRRSSRAVVASGATAPSLFEIVESFVNVDPVSVRVSKLFSDMRARDELMAELIILMAYLKFTHVPTSTDVIISYAGARGFDISDAIECVARMGKLKADYEDSFSFDQDYYSSRSGPFAERTMSACPPSALRMVLETLHREVSSMKITNYELFQRRAFSNEIFVRAFLNWKEGKALYEYIYDREKARGGNPYVMQQCALFLSRKRQHEEAFIAIEEAIRTSKNRVYSIRNTHAAVLFEANIEKEEDEGGLVRESLVESMEILRSCFAGDRRKIAHALDFGRYSVKLYDRYADEESRKNLATADVWLSQEVAKPTAGRSVRQVRNLVRSRMGSSS